MRQTWLFAMVFAMVFASPGEAKHEIEEKSSDIAVRIDISTQTMRVLVGGQQKYSWKVSTGRRGYKTPTGSYKPYRMHRKWYSRKYNNAPMPYSIFFRGGFAIHGTNHISRLGRPASHGCIRLHPANAATLFKLVMKHGRSNTTISLYGSWAWRKSQLKRHKKTRLSRKAQPSAIRKTKKRSYRRTKTASVESKKSISRKTTPKIKQSANQAHPAKRKRNISYKQAKRYYYREWKRVRTPSGRVIHYVWKH